MKKLQASDCLQSWLFTDNFCLQFSYSIVFFTCFLPLNYLQHSSCLPKNHPLSVSCCFFFFYHILYWLHNYVRTHYVARPFIKCEVTYPGWQVCVPPTARLQPVQERSVHLQGHSHTSFGKDPSLSHTCSLSLAWQRKSHLQEEERDLATHLITSLKMLSSLGYIVYIYLSLTREKGSDLVAEWKNERFWTIEKNKFSLQIA